jgi:hypothetical protein
LPYCVVFYFCNSLNVVCLECLPDVEQQVMRILKPYGEPDGGLSDIHLLQLSFGEEPEDGRCGMNGERTVVEQIRGTVDEFQPIEEKEAFLF